MFSYDLHSETREKSLMFIINSDDFLNGTGDTFNPSGTAIHPHSNDIYIIGSKEVKMVVCYGMNGEFKAALKLYKNQFKQPE